MTILKSLFDKYPNIRQWKIDLGLWIDDDTATLSETTVLLEMNTVPSGGSCTINPSVGYALKTFFLINCINWRDPDGIKTYEFFGILSFI